MTRDAAAEAARIAELQRLAYGRASTPAEAAHARAAAQELRELLAAGQVDPSGWHPSRFAPTSA